MAASSVEKPRAALSGAGDEEFRRLLRRGDLRGGIGGGPNGSRFLSRIVLREDREDRRQDDGGRIERRDQLRGCVVLGRLGDQQGRMSGSRRRLSRPPHPRHRRQRRRQRQRSRRVQQRHPPQPTPRTQAPHAGQLVQFVQQGLGRLRALGRVAGHHRPAQRRQPSRDLRVEDRNVRRLRILVIEQLLEHRPLRVRRATGEHVEQRTAQRIEVAADVRHPRILRLLRRDVVKGAQRGAGDGQVADAVRGFLPSQAQVDQLDDPVRGDDHVGRLHVPVHHAGGGAVVQRLGDLPGDGDRVRRAQRAVRLQQIADGAAGDELERDKVQPPILADVERPGDVRVVQAGGAAGFIAKPQHARTIAGMGRAEHLQGDGPLQALVDCLEDRTHAAVADPLLDAEVIQRAAGQRRIGLADRGEQPAFQALPVERAPARIGAGDAAEGVRIDRPGDLLRGRAENRVRNGRPRRGGGGVDRVGSAVVLRRQQHAAGRLDQRRSLSFSAGSGGARHACRLKYGTRTGGAGSSVRPAGSPTLARDGRAPQGQFRAGGSQSASRPNSSPTASRIDPQYAFNRSRFAAANRSAVSNPSTALRTARSRCSGEDGASSAARRIAPGLSRSAARSSPSATRRTRRDAGARVPRRCSSSSRLSLIAMSIRSRSVRVSGGGMWSSTA